MRKPLTAKIKKQKKKSTPSNDLENSMIVGWILIDRFGRVIPFQRL